MVEMTLKTIKINDTADRQYIGLTEKHGERTLTIVIGYLEVQAISRTVNDVTLERPMTHDLLTAVIKASGCSIERIEITELKGGTFYASIRLQRPDGTVEAIDARPSDAIALAKANNAPIFVAEDVLEEAMNVE